MNIARLYQRRIVLIYDIEFGRSIIIIIIIIIIKIIIMIIINVI